MADVIERVSLADQIAEVSRELRMRKNVFDRLVRENKLSAADAEQRMVRMSAVLRTLEQVRGDREARVDVSGQSR